MKTLTKLGALLVVLHFDANSQEKYSYTLFLPQLIHEMRYIDKKWLAEEVTCHAEHVSREEVRGQAHQLTVGGIHVGKPRHRLHHLHCQSCGYPTQQQMCGYYHTYVLGLPTPL